MLFPNFKKKNLREVKRLEIENSILPRNKQRPVIYAIGNAPAKSSDVKTNWRQIYFEVLDTVISCTTFRIIQKDYSKYYASSFNKIYLIYGTFMVTTSTDTV